MAVTVAMAAVERGGCGSRISPMANEELVGADASKLIPAHLLPTCFQHLSQLLLEAVERITQQTEAAEVPLLGPGLKDGSIWEQF